MTRKEALAALYRGLDTVFCTSLHTDPERDSERWQVYKDLRRALGVLTPLVHGKPPYESFGFLCDACYMKYAVYMIGHILYHDDVCQSCREAKAKQQASETSEVNA